MSSYVIKYEFVGQDSAGLRGVRSVSGQQSLRAFGWFSTDASMGAVPIAISVEKLLNRPFPGRAAIVRSIQRCLR